jgi:hypothetical protein
MPETYQAERTMMTNGPHRILIWVESGMGTAERKNRGYINV